MGLVTVNFECVDQEIVPNPVGTVVIRVYTLADVFVTEFTSDAVTGIATGLLDGAAAPTPNAYNIRIYKFAYGVTNPQQIEVYDPPAGSPTGTNDFKLTLDPHVPAAPADARLCRCSGYFRRVDGSSAGGSVDSYWNTARFGPWRGHILRFTSLMDPLIVDGAGAFSSPVYAEADADGLIEIDLFREGMYSVFVEDIHPGCIQEAMRAIHVPDRSTANLLDILFPDLADITWNPVGPWAVAAGGVLDVQPAITLTDYRVLEGTGTDDVTYSVDDPSIATLGYKDADTLTVTGVASGTTQLRVSRRDESIIRIPGSYTGGVVDITVT